ncbi:MAG: AAA family ATPase [Phycisphaera sp.]|nr:AAA family ATPase [Phycisphaera sp.]
MTLTLPDDTDRVLAFGAAERNLKLIREALSVAISARDDAVRVSGERDNVNLAADLITQLTQAAKRKRPMTPRDVIDRLHHMSETQHKASPDASREAIDIYTRSHRIAAKTAGQRRYLDAIQNHDMTFCTGPAGTGKTYLAVAVAVSMLKHGEVRRIVLARPAVEAGEKIGFLPGDMLQKVNPYLRPLLDAVHDMMPFEQAQKFMHTDLIEVIPLAFMRGRTLNDAAIILDEAQNTTKSQMLMFLTRMGMGSKVIVTGDTSQTDLEDGTDSGLIDAARRLRGLPGIGFVTLDRHDIVRHSLVQRIVEAYGQENAAQGRAD